MSKCRVGYFFYREGLKVPFSLPFFYRMTSLPSYFRVLVEAKREVHKWLGVPGERLLMKISH